LIPEADEDIDDSMLQRMLSGTKMHSGDSKAITNIESKG
jgi:hypothetical protein